MKTILEAIFVKALISLREKIANSMRNKSPNVELNVDINSIIGIDISNELKTKIHKAIFELEKEGLYHVDENKFIQDIINLMHSNITNLGGILIQNYIIKETITASFNKKNQKNSNNVKSSF